MHTMYNHIMKLPQSLLWSAFGLILLASCTAPTPESGGANSANAEPSLSEDSSAAPISYRIVKDETSDMPIKTQVELRLLVEGDLTDANLRELLNRVYGEVASRSGYTYNPHPTDIYIYVHTDQAHLTDGAAWIAMLQKNAKGTTNIHVNDVRLSQLTAPQEERFGLSEDKRKQIFREYVRAEDRASNEGNATHPNDFMKAYEVSLILQEEYKVALAEKEGITRDQLKDILTEGLQKQWPLPAMQ